jgi:hypothetical protein
VPEPTFVQSQGGGYFPEAMPLLSQTSPSRKLSFEVISIKPAAPLIERIIGGGTRGDRYTMKAATLSMLLQSAHQRPSATPVAPLKVIRPGWMDNDQALNLNVVASLRNKSRGGD